MSTEAVLGLAAQLIQLYVIAMKIAGRTEEQAKEYFLLNYDRFMEKTSKPVDPVKE